MSCCPIHSSTHCTVDSSQTIPLKPPLFRIQMTSWLLCPVDIFSTILFLLNVFLLHIFEYFKNHSSFLICLMTVLFLLSLRSHLLSLLSTLIFLFPSILLWLIWVYAFSLSKATYDPGLYFWVNCSQTHGPARFFLLNRTKKIPKPDEQPHWVPIRTSGSSYPPQKASSFPSRDGFFLLFSIAKKCESPLTPSLTFLMLFYISIL